MGLCLHLSNYDEAQQTSCIYSSGVHLCASPHMSICIHRNGVVLRPARGPWHQAAYRDLRRSDCGQATA
jgi:hypothetical protein